MPAANADDQRFDVFLSHNSRDKPVVRRIAEKLRRARLKPWLDAWHLVPGAGWQNGLAEGLAASRSCAVFVGPADLGAWENQEVAVALDRAARDANFSLFLVLLPGLPERFDAAGLSPFLRLRTWVDYRDGLDDERAFHALVSAINGLPLGPEVPLAPDTDVCPYRGLEAFEEEHADFFFGRDADEQRLLERLKGTRFLAVLGASGSGKSSLVRAGLVPALKQRALLGEEHWEIVILRPGARPLDTLATQLLRFGAAGAMQETLDGLAADPRTLHLASTLALAGRTGTRLLLVVDQFEEIFTLCRDEQARTAFFANLLYTATIPDGSGAVLVAMRADFYHRCGAYPELAQQLAAEQYLVSPLQPEGLRQAVEEPARRVGLAFEPGLVATILEDVADQPGGLPLLEHALLELWRRRKGGMLTLAGYRESGGVQGAISKRAEQVFESLDPEQQEFARRTFLRLTQPGEGTEDTRRRARMFELETSGGANDVAPVLARLVDARLVTTSREEAANTEVVEVAHEALIRGWPRLRAWIDEDRAGLRVHRRLTDAAREWERLGREESTLYRGAPLAEALEWRHANEESLNALERRFLDSSTAMRTREARAARQRVRRSIAGLATALVVISAVAVLAVLQTLTAARERETSFARELAANAVAQLPIDPELSLRLAIEAAGVGETTEVESALRKALIESRVRATFYGHKGTVYQATYSRDGALVVTAGKDRTARVWRARDGSLIAVLRGHSGSVMSAAFSPNRRLVVTASRDGTVRVWVVRGGKQLAVIRGTGSGFDESAVNAATFSPDGTRVVTAGPRHRAQIASARTGRQLLILRGHLPVLNAAFNADGSRVFTADEESVLLWDAVTGRQVAAVGGTGAAFSEDGTMLVTGFGEDAALWNAKNGQRMATFRTGSAYQVCCVTFSPRGDLVATSAADGNRIFRVRDRKQLALLDPGFAGLRTVAFGPDGTHAVTTDEDRTARVWETATGKEVLVLRGHKADVRDASFSPDGTRIVTASDDGRARLWATESADQGVVLDHGDQPVYGPSFSPDGSVLVTGAWDGKTRIWMPTGRLIAVLPGWLEAVSPDGDLIVTTDRGPESVFQVWRTDGQRVAVLPGHPPDVNASQESESSAIAAAFSPNSAFLAIAANARVARIWDVRAWKQTHILRGHEDLIFSLTFSHDSARVATSSYDGTAQIWSATDGERLAVVREPRGQYYYGAAFSSDDRWLVTVHDDGTTRIWASDTGKQHAVYGRNHSGVPVVSADGRLVITYSEDGTPEIRAQQTGALVAALRGHDGYVLDAAFSPDSKLVVTGSDDATARVWKSTTGDQLIVLRGHRDRILSVAFSPEGRRIATASDDGTARVYLCEACAPFSELVAFARSRATRELSPNEHAHYIH